MVLVLVMRSTSVDGFSVQPPMTSTARASTTALPLFFGGGGGGGKNANKQVTVNGKAVNAQIGQTVLAAAGKAGV